MMTLSALLCRSGFNSWWSADCLPESVALPPFGPSGKGSSRVGIVCDNISACVGAQMCNSPDKVALQLPVARRVSRLLNQLCNIGR